ncbi:MAG: hypothetical protein ACK4WC_00610 [Rubrimonas sp.]
MNERCVYRVDIETLPRSIQLAVEHYANVADILRLRVRQVACAAMARDPAIGAVAVAMENSIVRPLIVSRIVIEGVSDPSLRSAVEGRVMRILLDLGWREVRLARHRTWRSQLIAVERKMASAHELAAAARAVRL